ncbi:hypothetical protein A3J43_01320 [Candidatus Uhrbacteria bacterium RIFCSPHIGHO2_12_FULL_54_23]|uniref:ACT domain-containing protein n=3 Tax=Candidatus Uhriibacteriota TaxID=1752732 RepID=A0A1F7UMW4_9BACT|nr:MAG: hypothetical protein A3J43_01320 [Candidatus Uhrbacteria bacterium RIFCSPHIGHO2_12_FULL_54_23]OGL84838.1 MAG: hypothetical protein A3B36_00350 [Candidatus Uhrbacteria bacterium RIFCSPLOWO2_01_FULL_55_36]OGL90862.1 MAG: hypothetical protein A3J36_01915 [Candidatus Uhrbacteria bacterium RIFCSPLOWO2_02_FULL_54_37]
MASECVVKAIMKDITIIENDRPGLLASICSAFGRESINIKRFTAHGVGGKAVLTLGVTDPERALRVLRDNQINAVVDHVLIVKLDDKPGALADITLKLKDAGCNLKTAYIVGRNGLQVFVAVSVDEPQRAEMVLGDIIVSEG